MNMGIEPFLVAASVNLIQAQRLIRRICKDCEQDHPTPPEAMIEVGFTTKPKARRTKVRVVRRAITRVTRDGWSL